MKTVTPFIAKRGPMQRIDLIRPGFGRLVADIDDPAASAQLPDVRPNLKLDLPKIPWDAPRGGYIQLWRYFDAVFRQQKSEGFVWLHWNADAKEYCLVVPSFYTATAGGLRYPPEPERFCATCQVAMFDAADFCPHCRDAGRPTPTVFVGDVHSHGDLSPYHSGVDDADEVSGTGIHLTFGRLTDGPTRVAHSFVLGDGPTRFTTDWTDHFPYTRDALADDRLRLWLTLLAPGAPPARVVRRRDQSTVYEGVQPECEWWLRSRRDADEYTVQTGTTTVRPETPGVQRKLVVVDRPAPRPEQPAPARTPSRTPWPTADYTGPLDNLLSLLNEAESSNDAYLLHLLCYDLLGGRPEAEVKLDALIGALSKPIVDHLRREHELWFTDVQEAVSDCVRRPDDEQEVRWTCGPVLLDAINNLDSMPPEVLHALMADVVYDDRAPQASADLNGDFHE